MHPFIKHVFTVQPHKGDWIMYNKTVGGTEILVYTDEEFRNIREEGRVLCIKIEPDQYKEAQFLFCLNTCVGHTKKLIGMSRPFVLTPYQLFKELQKK